MRAQLEGMEVPSMLDEKPKINIRAAAEVLLQGGVLAGLSSKLPALQERACEQAAILASLENLMTYPWIARRVEAGALHLHGWYFDIGKGELLGYSPLGATFEPLAPLHGGAR